MSPEQAAGEKEIDGRSDLYSLGVVTYQMLAGELPFNAPTVAGILMKQITEPAPTSARTRPDVPEDLALAVARCLEKDPENRWPTADALRRALESRTVTGYRPTGTSWRAGSARSGTASQRPSTNANRRPLAGNQRSPIGGGANVRSPGSTFLHRAARARPTGAMTAGLRGRSGTRRAVKSRSRIPVSRRSCRRCGRSSPPGSR